MFKKKKTYIILVILILIIGGFYYSKSKAKKIEYTTSDAVRGNLVRTVSVTGTVTPVTQVDLSFKTGGKLMEINVAVGDQIAKGENIATIDKGTLGDDLAQAQAELAAQKKTLSNMKIHSAYTPQQANAQKAQVDKAQSAVSSVKSEIGDTVMYSPIDGIVTAKNYEIGESIPANSALTDNPVVSIAGDDGLEIDADVPESDIVKVALGQKADLTFDAFTANDIFPATVTKIDPASTVIQDVVYYKVKLMLDSPEPRLKNGMSTDIDINTAEKDNVVSCPLRAVKTENGSKYVEVLKDEKNNITEKVPVTTGLEGDDGMVEITSGLSGGEKVVTLTKTL
jgi:HlyD family secretion protein